MVASYCDGPEWLKELVVKTEKEINEDWEDYTPEWFTADTSTLPELNLVTKTYACAVQFSDEDQAGPYMEALKRYWHALKLQAMADLREPRWVRIWPEFCYMPAIEQELWKVRVRCRLYVPSDYRGIGSLAEGETVQYIGANWGLEEP